MSPRNDDIEHSKTPLQDLSPQRYTDNDTGDNGDGIGKADSPPFGGGLGARKTSVTADEGLTGMSLFEKKCVLINREFDAMGMGRYQWMVWGLCGFGYMLDLLWAEAFGLILGPLQQELGFANDQTGNISTAFAAGLTAGAAFWGILVDIIGRRSAFNLTVLFSSVFGTALGAPTTYNTFLVLTAFVGFGVGGNIPIDTTITLEFLPQNRRSLLALLSIFQPIGVVVCCGIAYGFIPRYSCEPNFAAIPPAVPLPSCNNVSAGTPCCTKASNMGWRYLMYTMGAITLFVLFLRVVVFKFQESPKFLIYRGKDEKAIQVMQRISKMNRRECHLTLATLEALTEEEDSLASDSSSKPILAAGAKQLQSTYWEKAKLEGARYKMLFATPAMTYLTILVWLTYAMDYWGFSIAGGYLPLIVALKNSALSVSLTETYRDYVYIYLPGTVGVVLGAMAYHVPSIGRKWAMVFSVALMGVSIFIFAVVNSQASNIGLNAMEYFFQSMFNAVLYGWTPEAFPAPVRGTAAGLASFWGRLFSIIAPLVAQRVYDKTVESAQRVLYMAGGVTLGCVLTTAALPNSAVGAESL